MQQPGAGHRRFAASAGVPWNRSERRNPFWRSGLPFRPLIDRGGMVSASCAFVMRTHRLPVLFTVLTLAPALWLPTGAGAQRSCPDKECQGLRMGADLEQELGVAGVNALLGGVTAAISRGLRGEPVWDAFVAGALGGGVVYAGKRLAAEEFDGAGFLGREVASVGASVVRNAAAGRGMLSEVVLPLGPVRLYVSRETGVLARLDIATVVAAGAFMAQDGRFDARASLSSGALVFRGPTTTPGISSAGAIMTWDDLPLHEGPRLLAHERIHVLQYDQAYLSWGEPPERWMAERVPFGRALLRHVDAGGLMLGLQAGLRFAIDYHARPWEREAYLLAELAHPLSQGEGPVLVH